MTSKTKTIIMVALLLLNVVLGYWLYHEINKDVKAKAITEEIDGEVIAKLQDIRDCQVAYRSTNGKFAATFPELISWVKTGYVYEFKKSGDKDRNPNEVIKLDTIRKEAMVEIFGNRNYDIDNLGKVPPMDTAQFILEVGSVEKNEVTLPTFQVTDPHPYNQDRTLKVGDLFDAVEDGNWK